MYFAIPGVFIIGCARAPHWQSNQYPIATKTELHAIPTLYPKPLIDVDSSKSTTPKADVSHSIPTTDVITVVSDVVVVNDIGYCTNSWVRPFVRPHWPQMGYSLC